MQREIRSLLMGEVVADSVCALYNYKFTSINRLRCVRSEATVSSALSGASAVHRSDRRSSQSQTAIRSEEVDLVHVTLLKTYSLKDCSVT